jgi:hypothetical protein
VTARVAARVPSAAASLTAAPPFWTTDALTATMGDGSLPPALEAAIAAVCAGERAVVSVDASALTGGPRPVPLPSPPPPRVELDVTLTTMLQVRDLTGDGGVVKRREREGRGEFPADCPLADTVVRVRAAATNEGDGAPFWTVGGGVDAADDDDDDGGGARTPPLAFTTGTDAVPSALDKGVRLMTPGERATLVATPPHAWRDRGDAPPGYDPTRATRFDVVLASFDAPVRDYDATPADRLARARALREQGNAVWAAAGGPNAGALAAAKWRAAAHELANALDFAEATEAEIGEAAACRAAAHANLALAASARDAWGEAIDWADKALEDDPGHVKALLRKARAAAVLGRTEVAAAALVPAFARAQQLQQLHLSSAHMV